jgi:hypothetical protein
MPGEPQRKYKMKNLRELSLTERLGTVALALTVASWTYAANPPSDTKPPVPALLQKMEGNWTVTEKMWPGNGHAAVDLPAGGHEERSTNGSVVSHAGIGKGSQGVFGVRISIYPSAVSPLQLKSISCAQ